METTPYVVIFSLALVGIELVLVLLRRIRGGRSLFRSIFPRSVKEWDLWWFFICVFVGLYALYGCGDKNALPFVLTAVTVFTLLWWQITSASSKAVSWWGSWVLVFVFIAWATCAHAEFGGIGKWQFGKSSLYLQTHQWFYGRLLQSVRDSLPDAAEASEPPGPLRESALWAESRIRQPENIIHLVERPHSGSEVLEIWRPRRVWHTWFTRLHYVEHIPVEFWYLGPDAPPGEAIVLAPVK